MRPDETSPEDPSVTPPRPSDEERADRSESRSSFDAGNSPDAADARSPRGLEILQPHELDDDDLDEEDDESLDDEDFEDEDDVRTILITGASGRIGQKLRAAWGEIYDLVLLDKVAGHDDEVIAADLTELDDGWITHFHGVDTVVHLAALPNVDATWEELIQPNIDAMSNVLHACALAGVERVVFASSSHVMGGYLELADMPITPDLPPRPDSAYGATKLMGERLGRSLARAFDLSFVALRLGWIQAGENRPDTLPDDAARNMWISNRDLVRLFECAIEVELDEPFVVVNGMSNNRGSRWDITATAERLGFIPEDDAYAEEL